MTSEKHYNKIYQLETLRDLCKELGHMSLIETAEEVMKNQNSFEPELVQFCEDYIERKVG
jgi:hypothetical protein